MSEQAASVEDVSSGNYGSYGLVQSTEKREEIHFVDIGKINASLDGTQVRI